MDKILGQSLINGLKLIGCLHTLRQFTEYPIIGYQTFISNRLFDDTNQNAHNSRHSDELDHDEFYGD